MKYEIFWNGKLRETADSTFHVLTHKRAHDFCANLAADFLGIIGANVPV